MRLRTYTYAQRGRATVTEKLLKVEPKLLSLLHRRPSRIVPLHVYTTHTGTRVHAYIII